MKLKIISLFLLLTLVLGLFAGCGTKPATQPNDVPNPPVQDVPNPPAQDDPVPPVQDDPVPPVQDDPVPPVQDDPVSPENPDTPAAPVFYTVSLEHDSSKATVSGLGDSYESGSSVSFTVQPADGYIVDKVTCNDAEITASNGSYSFVISADTAVKVTCRVRPVAIVLTNDDSRGTVNGLKSEYTEGEKVTFSVTAKVGWAVYSVTVDGVEQDLPYSFPAANDGDYTTEIAVTYEDDSLEARRQKVVTYAQHFVGDYYYYETDIPRAASDVTNNLHKGRELYTDRIYRGVPYNEGLTSLAAYRTVTTDFVDDIYHVDPTLFVQRWYWLFGASCGDVPLWAWRTIDSSVDFASATQMTPDHGCIPVGEYRYTVKNGSFVDTFADIEKNGSDVMYKAYDQLQPGDACTRYKSGKAAGHAILITAVDPKNNRVTYCDTNGNARDAKTSIDGMDVYCYGDYAKTVSYSKLMSEGYLPVTCKALRDETVSLNTFEVTGPSSTPTLKNLASGTLSATQAISHVVIRIYDAEGKEVKQYIRYWKDDTFKMSDFRSTRLLTGWDDYSSYTEPQYQLYSKENTIDVENLGLAAGNYRCTVTVYNGGTSFDSDGNIRSTAYKLKDFNFTL